MKYLRWIILVVFLVLALGMVAVIFYLPDSTPSQEMTAAEKSQWLQDAYTEIGERMNRAEFIGAEERAREIVSKYPDESDAWLILAQIRIAQTNWQEAYSYTINALKVEESSAENQHTAGILAVRLGLLDQARRHHIRSVQLAPDQALYRMHLGETFRRLGELDKADEQLNAALMIHPGMAEAHAALASVRIAQDQKDKALARLTLAIQLAEDSRVKRTTYVIAKGQLLRTMERPQEAIAVLLSVPANEWTEELASELAGAFIEAGQPIGAAEAWEQYFELEPSFTVAAARAGIYYHAAGDIRRATEFWIESSGSLHPDAQHLDRLMKNLPRTPTRQPPTNQ